MPLEPLRSRITPLPESPFAAAALEHLEEVAERQDSRPVFKTIFAERPTAADPGETHPASGPEAVPLDRFVRIFGTGRQMPALAADETRQAQLITPDRPVGRPLDGAWHYPSPIVRPVSI